MNDLVVLVLAGGSGTRFWPLTTDKILFPFLGKPFITATVGSVLPRQTSKIVIVTNEMNHADITAMKFPAQHITLIQKQSKGMADAVLTAKEEIAHHPLLILIADDLVDPSLFQNVVDYGEQHDVLGVLPGWRPVTYFPGGYFIFENGVVRGIIEKPEEHNIPSDFVNISGHYFNTSDILIDMLQQVTSSEDNVYETAITQLMRKETFHIFPYEGNFLSLKYPWHVISVMDELLSTMKEYRGDDVDIKSNVIIEGPVHIGSNVRIFENTKIVGPCYIGDNTIVGNNNVIRHSMIGAGCVTGFNTDITRSYIGNSCWFHSNYVGDSVLEENISMGSGTVLANLRLDESDISSMIKDKRISTKRNKLGAIIGKHVRIGVNASIMPGVKIGAQSMIGAGLTISQDIPNNSFVTGKTTLEIQSNTKHISADREEFKKKL